MDELCLPEQPRRRLAERGGFWRVSGWHV